MSHLFKIVYLLGLIIEIAIRIPRERQRRQIHMHDQRVSAVEHGLLGLLFIGTFFIPMLHIFTSWLSSANYNWSETTKARAGSLGTVLFGLALWLFWRAHVDLGRNWSPSLEIGERQTLVTHGVYSGIRHPMYASHWLWSIAQALILQNWIAGPASLALFLPLYLVRVPREEQMMLDHFADDYHKYMARNGRVVPRIRR